MLIVESTSSIKAGKADVLCLTCVPSSSLCSACSPSTVSVAITGCDGASQASYKNIHCVAVRGCWLCSEVFRISWVLELEAFSLCIKLWWAEENGIWSHYFLALHKPDHMISFPPPKNRDEAWGRERKQEKGSAERRRGEGGSSLESLHLHAFTVCKTNVWKRRIGRSRMLQMAVAEWI